MSQVAENKVVKTQCDHWHILHPLCESENYSGCKKAATIGLVILVNVLLVGVPFIIYTAYKFFTKPSTSQDNSNLRTPLEIQDGEKKGSLSQTSSRDIQKLHDQRSNSSSTTPNNPFPTPQNNQFTRLPTPTKQEELNRGLKTPITGFSPLPLQTEIEKPAASSWRDQLVPPNAQNLAETIVQLGRDICKKCPQESAGAVVLPNIDAFTNDFSKATGQITVKISISFLGINDSKLKFIEYSFENLQNVEGSPSEFLKKAMQKLAIELADETQQRMLEDRCSAKWDLRCPRIQVGVRIRTEHSSWFLTKFAGLGLEGAWSNYGENYWDQLVRERNEQSGFSTTASPFKPAQPVVKPLSQPVVNVQPAVKVVNASSSSWRDQLVHISSLKKSIHHAVDEMSRHYPNQPKGHKPHGINLENYLCTPRNVEVRITLSFAGLFYFFGAGDTKIFSRKFNNVASVEECKENIQDALKSFKNEKIEEWIDIRCQSERFDLRLPHCKVELTIQVGGQAWTPSTMIPLNFENAWKDEDIFNQIVNRSDKFE